MLSAPLSSQTGWLIWALFRYSVIAARAVYWGVASSSFWAASGRA